MERGEYMGHKIVIIRKQYIPSGESESSQEWKYTREGFNLREDVFCELTDVMVKMKSLLVELD